MTSSDRIHSLFRQLRETLGFGHDDSGKNLNDREGGSSHADSQLPDDPATWGADELSARLTDGDLEAHRRVIGSLVGRESVSEDEARRLATVLCDNLEGVSHFKIRLAIRGLRAIHEHHPVIVHEHIDQIVRGFVSYRFPIRRETARTVEAMLTEEPSLAGAVYPLLTTPVDQRKMVLTAIVEAATVHPEILHPIVPALEGEIHRDELPRPLLARAVRSITESHAAIAEDLLTETIEWVPADDAILDREIVLAIAHRDVMEDADQERMIRAILGILAADRVGEPEPARWLATALDRDPDLGRIVAEWAQDRPRRSRRLVLARIDEVAASVDEPLVEWLSLTDDPIIEH